MAFEKQGRSKVASAEPRVSGADGGSAAKQTTGSDDDAAAAQAEVTTGARPRSEITGKHDAGSGANETMDGLNSTDEALRRAVEDIPSRERPDSIEDVPVFDRGELPPKI